MKENMNIEEFEIEYLSVTDALDKIGKYANALGTLKSIENKRLSSFIKDDFDDNDGVKNIMIPRLRYVSHGFTKLNPVIIAMINREINERVYKLVKLLKEANIHIDNPNKLLIMDLVPDISLGGMYVDDIEFIVPSEDEIITTVKSAIVEGIEKSTFMGKEKFHEIMTDIILTDGIMIPVKEILEKGVESYIKQRVNDKFFASRNLDLEISEDKEE